MKKTKFIFVRHGQTNRNTQGRLPDGTDDPLNEIGRDQAKQTAANIPLNIDVLVTSPLARAAETGEIIRNAAGLNLIVELPDTRIAEVNFGDLKGKTWDEVAELYPGTNLLEKYRNQEYDFSEYKGDSFLSTKERIYSFIEDMKEKYSGKTILVATHAGIIRTICKAERGQTFPDAPKNAEVFEFEF